jgi:hypothetical protein
MKAWWKSKTFWLNLATLGIASALDQPSTPVVTQALAVVNIVLRFITNKPIGNP